MIELNQVAQRNSEGCDHMINRVCTRDNIALVALLKTKHLFWDPGKRNVLIFFLSVTTIFRFIIIFFFF